MSHSSNKGNLIFFCQRDESDLGSEGLWLAHSNVPSQRRICCHAYIPIPRLSGIFHVWLEFEATRPGGIGHFPPGFHCQNRALGSEQLHQSVKAHHVAACVCELPRASPEKNGPSLTQTQRPLHFCSTHPVFIWSGVYVCVCVCVSLCKK